MTDVTELEVTYNTACAVTGDGAVYCWGDVSYLFEYADNPDTTRGVYTAPVVVPYVSDAVQVSTHGYVACARQASNELVCWGLSGSGATGNGQIENGEDYSGLPMVWQP